MKKVIILSIFGCTVINTNMLSMLLKKVCIVPTAKSLVKTKNFCHKQHFDYDDLILQTITENNVLRAESYYLQQKITLLLTAQNQQPLTDTQEVISFRSEDKRSSGQE